VLKRSITRYVIGDFNTFFQKYFSLKKMNFSLSVRTEQQNRRLSRGYTLKKNNNTTGILGGSNEYFVLDCFETPLNELEKSFNNLSEHFKNIKNVQASLDEFNKAFSGFLYGIKMNAHCVEFSEVLPSLPKDIKLISEVNNILGSNKGNVCIFYQKTRRYTVDDNS
jgi:hypothetical protein